MMAATYAGLRQLPESRPAIVPHSTTSAAQRAVLMLRALGDYGRLMVFPSNLHMERSVSDPIPVANREGWRSSIRLEYLSLAGVAVLAAFAFGAFRKGAGRKARIFGASWFLLAYLPISNLFPLNASVAEHWLYLPSVGFLIFLAGVAFELPAYFRRVAFALACLAVVALSARSAIRSSDWIDPETFYQRTFLAGGSSCRVGVNLAMLYSKRGEHGQAEKILRKVLRVYPDYPVARNNLADVLFRQGKTTEAEAMFDSASRTAPEDRHEYPRTWVAALNYARLRHKEKDDQTALTVMAKARKEYPGIWDLISFEAELLRENRGPAAALPLVQDFVRAHWWHSGASIALGRLHSEMGDHAQGRSSFRHASWLDVHDAEALNLMALLSVRQNKLEEACQTQRRAVARQPDQPRQYLLLSDILSKMGRAEEAQAALAEVSEMKAIAEAPDCHQLDVMILRLRCPEMTQSNIKAAAGSLWSKLAAYAERQWVRCLSLVVLGAGVHLPALPGQLIWDDFYLTRDNPMIRSPVADSWKHFGTIFSPTLTQDITALFKRSPTPLII